MAWWSVRDVGHDPPYEMFIIEAENYEHAVEKAAVVMHKRWGSMADTEIKYEVGREPVYPRSSASKRDELEKALDPRTRPVQMTLEDACAELSASVYGATELFERLESAGLVHGNGHHARQRVARLAVLELRDRWKNEEEKGS